MARSAAQRRVSNPEKFVGLEFTEERTPTPNPACLDS
jgi:hypothetical protein